MPETALRRRYSVARWRQIPACTNAFAIRPRSPLRTPIEELNPRNRLLEEFVAQGG
jgi:hypothetical protein